jgi:hypothetical protein
MNIVKYLILNKYLLSLFGASDFRDLQEKLKDAPVGVDSDGRSYFISETSKSLYTTLSQLSYLWIKMLHQALIE